MGRHPKTPRQKVDTLKPLKKATRSEKAIQDAIIKRLKGIGFTLISKSHCSAFQKGWPDLYCYHPEHGSLWVEVKKPKTGRLTKAQKVVFPKWVAAGVPLWILTHEDQVDDIPHSLPNCGEWLSGPSGKVQA